MTDYSFAKREGKQGGVHTPEQRPCDETDCIMLCFWPLAQLGLWKASKLIWTEVWKSRCAPGICILLSGTHFCPRRKYKITFLHLEWKNNRRTRKSCWVQTNMKGTSTLLLVKTSCGECDPGWNYRNIALLLHILVSWSFFTMFVHGCLGRLQTAMPRVTKTGCRITGQEHNVWWVLNADPWEVSEAAVARDIWWRGQ